MRDLRDALILWLLSDLFSLSASALVTVSHSVSQPLSMTLIVSAAPLYVASIGAFALAAISAYGGVAGLVRGAR